MRPARTVTTLGEYVQLLVAGWRTVATTTLLGLVLAAGWMLITPTTYEGAAEVLVRPTLVDPLETRARIDQMVFMDSEIQLGSTLEIAQRAHDGLVAQGVPAPAPEQLLAGVRLFTPPNSQVLRFEYRSHDRGLARAVAQAFATVYLDSRREQAMAMRDQSVAALAADLHNRQKQLDRAIAAISQMPRPSAPRSIASGQAERLAAQVAERQRSLATVASWSTDPGEVVRAAAPAVRGGVSRRLLVASSTAGGWLAGVLLLGWRYRRGRWVVPARLAARRLGVPLMDHHGDDRARRASATEIAGRLAGSGARRVGVVPSSAGPADESTVVELADALAATGLAVGVVGTPTSDLADPEGVREVVGRVPGDIVLVACPPAGTSQAVAVARALDSAVLTVPPRVAWHEVAGSARLVESAGAVTAGILADGQVSHPRFRLRQALRRAPGEEAGQRRPDGEPQEQPVASARRRGGR
jgi:hypothetical protein